MAFELTLDKPTKVWLKDFYTRDAHTILEYGSGGSTFLALDSNPDTKIYCCETDVTWLQNVCQEIKNKNYDDRFVPLHLDVGSTGAWGTPTFKDGTSLKRNIKMTTCTQGPWDYLKKQGDNPSVVFIDGRFRTACFLSTLLNTKTSVTVIWDDYRDRSYYQIFDDVIKPREMVGRAAIFSVHPRQYDAAKIINKYLQVYGDWR